MNIDQLQKQTNANIQAKANLIWSIADNLRGLFKPHEYGKVILPLTVLKRFDDALKPTKAAVIEMAKTYQQKNINTPLSKNKLCDATGYPFYNVSPFDFSKLVADSNHVGENFLAYLNGFSENVIDIIKRFEFENTVHTMIKGGVLFATLLEFNAPKGDMSPETITSTDMGYVFEELIRKFSESYDEQAGAHFTSRDIIYLMTDLLIAPEKDAMRGGVKSAYDMAMGTSQMLGCLVERMRDLGTGVELVCHGQEFNPETYAIAKADTLIKGGNDGLMCYGDTLSKEQDKFENFEFDYIISNPPFGIDWKREKKEVEAEHKEGFEGRFGPGLPAVSDGQMLFMLNGIKKLKPSGRMAIIQNGSSLFTGDAGSGASEIRRYALEQDLVEAIVQLPTDLFYNTGITTYVWLMTKQKAKNRRGKVQLLDASKCFVKRRKNIGSKRVDLDGDCLKLILDAYQAFEDQTYTQGELVVTSKVFDNTSFGFTKVTVETAQTDAQGQYVLKKGQKQPTKGASDTEIIPLNQDIDAYMAQNVLPYNPHAYIDHAKDKIGYEIPFTRLFYTFTPPVPSQTIFEEIKDLEQQEAQLMKELFGHA